jgi:formylglycine-generating enzyme required for sulfatase activity
MSQRGIGSHDDDQSMTPSYLERVITVCDDFEAAWRNGREPWIEDYLLSQPELIRPALLREMLAIELELRVRFGEALVLQDYLDRFPSDAVLVRSIFQSARTNAGSTRSCRSIPPLPGAEACEPPPLDAPTARDRDALGRPIPSLGTDPFDDSSGAAVATSLILPGLGPDQVLAEPPGGPLPRPLGRFTLLGLIGQGTYGAVFRAHDDILDREVAIKLPRYSASGSSSTVATSLTEAKNAARLRHPAIVTVYDVVPLDDGTLFVVMEYVEGSTLRDELKAGPVAPERAAALIAQVAEALHYAHTKGFVHRDLKPANILIDRLGHPHVADFGLAVHEATRPGRSGELAGTAPYMAPEQVRGEAHRLDGRTDVWALGVILYELLARRRPFTGPDREKVFEEIVYREAKPPRQLESTVPRELERICLKCLSKRMTDRYPDAAELAEDLRGFLAARAFAEESSSRRRAAGRLAKVVPKGLRSFSPEDAHFFLELMPGPKDRDGLPEIVRFWKTRIEATDHQTAFALGLIFGPSGCGKSSLVQAGILPCLADSILPVSIAASSHGTEAELLRRLLQRCPDLAGDEELELGQIDLPEALRRLRSGRGRPAGKKLLIVLDQFEQYLQSCRALEASPLVEALRQCDGVHVQCLVLVRDDFWMALTRFLRMLEIDLSSNRNMTAIDLFDRRHARCVLAAFGRGYGALAEDPEALTAEQGEFLDQAIDGLAEDDRVICVRLALFAAVFKDRPWTPSSLRELGGIPGAGVVFLEATIGSHARHPVLSLQGEAGRAVLKALLPPAGSSLKGRIRSYAELSAAAGDDHRPGEFQELLNVLDSELRLITPVEKPDAHPGPGDDHAGPCGAGVLPAGSLIPAGRRHHEDESAASLGPEDETALRAPEGPTAFYQLTHDYLVPSIREWLECTQRQTRRGRALLRLDILTELWTSRPEPRNLPSFPEWLTIRWHTRPRDWTPAARAMMGAATHRLGIHLVAALAVLVCLGVGCLALFERQHRVALYNQLLIARAGEIANRVREFQPYLGRFRWQLERRARDPQDPEGRVRASLALLPEDPSQVDILVHRLQELEVNPEEWKVIRDELKRHQAGLAAEACWQVVTAPAADRVHRLRAASALALLDPKDPAWTKHAREVAAALVKESEPLLWAERLHPVRDSLIAPLLAIYTDETAFLPDRLGAAEILADFFRADGAVDPTRLAELVLDASPEQFRSVFSPLRRLAGTYHEAVLERLKNELTKQPEPRRDDVTLKDASSPGASIADRLKTALGQCDDRFAYCLTLPLDDFRTLVNELKLLGYRPSCVRPYVAGGKVLVAAVWARDGLDFRLELDLTAGQVRQQNAAFRSEWEQRGKGFLPIDVACYRSPRRDPDSPEGFSFAALWVAAQRRPGGGLAPLEFIDSRLDVGVDERDHAASDREPDRARFVPRTSVAVADRTGRRWVSSVRWKFADSLRYERTWDLADWATVEKRVRCAGDAALMPADVRFSCLGPPGALAYTTTWWSGVDFESRAVQSRLPEAHRKRCESLASEGFRPMGIAAVEVAAEPGGRGRGRASDSPERRGVQIATASVWRRPLVADADKDRLARRQANAAIALFWLGHPEHLQEHLAHFGDPRLRSELIERLAADRDRLGLAPFEVDPGPLAHHLNDSPPPEASVRRALLLALASIPIEKVPSSLHDDLKATLARLYRDDPDRGVHSAAELVLRNWRLDDVLQRAFAEIPRESDPLGQAGRAPAALGDGGKGKQWFVTPGGRTMIIIGGPIEFTMGSPGNEPLRNHDQEPLRPRRINRTIAVATKEVTYSEFLRFFPRHGHDTAYGPDPECPVNNVTWYAAARFCNELSKAEGLESCYPDAIASGMVLDPDPLSRPGYRLPTEAEWEAFARAGTSTTWYFGHSEAMVSRYAWTVADSRSKLRSRPVGELLPNDFGLFDTVGNVFEWCHDRYDPNRPGLCDEPRVHLAQMPTRDCEMVVDGQNRVMRGGSFLSAPLQGRSAYRGKNPVNSEHVSIGFRVVRTLEVLPDPDEPERRVVRSESHATGDQAIASSQKR